MGSVAVGTRAAQAPGRPVSRRYRPLPMPCATPIASSTRKASPLEDPRAATPIGLGCRICERRDCAQQARPTGRWPTRLRPVRRTHVPYPVEPSGSDR
ncbi:short-chain fatty acyl-CoA regulator family protein [Streptomyces sp. Pv4-95]|uniref:short-chain fatty acyl-CoA regulator family protein n=1 Tax=Streptomyces sp. Pv4-95 TaxID=3049543 RepID=UPI003891FBFF